MEEGRSSFKILIGKSTGKRPLESPRRRWEDNIRMDLKEIGINTRNWVDLAQDTDYWRPLVNAAVNLRVTQSTKLVHNFSNYLSTCGFSHSINFILAILIFVTTIIFMGIYVYQYIKKIKNLENLHKTP